jgi:hypothetical protein
MATIFRPSGAAGARAMPRAVFASVAIPAELRLPWL